jgi:hypothetical protein
MNGNWASYPKVSLSLVFKNPTKEDSYLYYATPGFAEKAFRGVRSEYSVIRCEFQFTDYFLLFTENTPHFPTSPLPCPF